MFMFFKRSSYKKFTPRLSPFMMVIGALALVAVGFILFVAVYEFVHRPTPLPEGVTPPSLSIPTPAPQAPLPVTQSAPPGLPNTPILPYETPVDDFEARTRAVDMAILQALATQGKSQNAIEHKAVETRNHDGQEFYYQNLTVTLTSEVFPFLVELRRSLQALAPDATMVTISGNPRDIEISILGEATHHLFLPMAFTSPRPSSQAARPRLVIVIDDLGESLAVARRLVVLPFPVTLSVLPYNTHARAVGLLAREKNLELLLHLPCEPHGYPTVANSGPGTLRADMTEAQLLQTLDENLAQLPDVDGVNNHMGSRLTEDPRAMTVILRQIRGRGKFFLDSLTTPNSSVREICSRLGLPYYRRQIFLDNTPTERAVLLQLKKAESLAKRTGLAVVIGHPYPATLAALEVWAKTRDTRVAICKIGDI